ncbi:MAG: carbohydrate ABC transporter permease [Clostridiaceae bacterium]
MIKKSFSRKTFDVFNSLFMILLSASVIFPFIHIISISLSKKDYIMSKSVGLIPKGFNLGAYRIIITDDIFQRAFANTIFLTAVITILSMIVNVIASYAFTKNFYGKKFINYIYLITMFFSGGIIPYFILIAQKLHWYNNFCALIFPALVSYYYIIIIRSQIATIPSSLIESAYIDGANELRTIVHIVIPSILPTIAAISMFTAIGAWNQWFPNLLFTDKKSLWTLQYYLRAIVLEKSMDYKMLYNIQYSSQGTLFNESALTSVNYQMAAIIVVIIPVASIYPFIQKHFVKGILLGSVKG